MTWNGAVPFTRVQKQEFEDALGIPQFPAEESFYLVQNGLIIQGGKVSGLSAGNNIIAFPAAFTKQILTLQIQRTDVNNHSTIISGGTDLTQMTVNLTGSGGAIYWYAVGV